MDADAAVECGGVYLSESRTIRVYPVRAYVSNV
jgi:hypothetical protein